MTDTTPRVDPPDLDDLDILDIDPPACPLCSDQLTVRGDDRWHCVTCAASWSDDDDGGGEWDDPDAPQCPASQAVHDPRAATLERYRCVLADGHIGTHKDPRHDGLEWASRTGGGDR